MSVRIEFNDDFPKYSRDIKCNFTANTFSLIVNSRPQYSGGGMATWSDTNVILTWDITFDQLLANPRSINDDSWVFPYRTNIGDLITPDIFYLEGNTNNDIAPLYMARILIRPHTTSFLDSIMTFKIGLETNLVINGEPYADYIAENPHTLNATAKLITLVPLGDLRYRFVYKDVQRDFDLHIRPSAGRTCPEVIRTANGVAEFTYIPPRLWSNVSLNLCSKYNLLAQLNVSKE